MVPRISERDYRDPKYKKWRKDVARRDGYSCQWPGCRSNKRLRFHHIRTWARYPGLRFVLDNGITLCKRHHDLVHGHESDYEQLFNMLILQKKKGQKKIQLKILQDIRAEMRQWEKSKSK